MGQPYHKNTQNGNAYALHSSVQTLRLDTDVNIHLNDTCPDFTNHNRTSAVDQKWVDGFRGCFTGGTTFREDRSPSLLIFKTHVRAMIVVELKFKNIFLR